jgi:transposase
LVSEEKLTLPEAARRLGVSTKTLANWVHRARAGRLSTVGESRQPVTDVEAENARLRRELAEARMERGLLKTNPRGAWAPRTGRTRHSG